MLRRERNMDQWTNQEEIKAFSLPRIDRIALLLR
jgi:hypothetical protein